MFITRYLDPKNDVAFLRIFGQDKNSDILIHFINDVLRLDNPIEDIEILHPTQNPDIAYKKQSIVDVLCKDSVGDQYIVELQVYPYPGFEKKAIFYASRTYCRQKEKDQNNMRDYANLKDVYFIAITNDPEDKQAYLSNQRILDEESGTHDLKGLNFVFIELSKFPKTNIDELDNMIEQWCYFFKYAPEFSVKDIQKIIDNDGIIIKAYKELDCCYWTHDELDQYEQSTKRQADNMSAMLAARDRGWEAGFAKARSKAAGLEEGKTNKSIEIALNMLSDGLNIDTIIKYTGLSKPDIIKLKKNNSFFYKKRRIVSNILAATSSYWRCFLNMSSVKKTIAISMILGCVIMLGELYIFYTIFTTVKSNVTPAMEVHKKMMSKKPETKVIDDYDEAKKEVKRRFEYAIARTHLKEHGQYPEYDEGLFQAIHTADYRTLQILLKHGADPNAVDEFGSTPLGLLLLKKDYDMNDMLEELLSYNVDINKPFSYEHHQYYPIQAILLNLCATDRNQETEAREYKLDYLPKAANRLLNLGVILDTDNNTPDIPSPLVLILRTYKYFKNDLAKYKFDPNSPTGRYIDLRPLMHTIRNVSTTKALLAVGADPKLKNKVGFTAYCYACSYGNDVTQEIKDILFDAAYTQSYIHIKWLDRQINKIIAYKDCFYQFKIIERVYN